MASTQSFRAAAGCSACRLTAFQLFLSNTLPVRTSRLSIRATGSSGRATSSFSTFRPALQEHKSPAVQELRTEDQSGHVSGSANVSEANGEDVPWYLQVEPPKHPTLIVEPPPLPDIPEGAPKIAEKLVKFTSDELGMEDVEILDLRDVDPPPALGPGLMMLFGTARSERHLHVSADRLVRWFRGQGVSSDADGLLGRNELKTKLRRIARKQKRLGHGYARNSQDDGISTQWVCINAGTVASVEAESEVLDEEGRVTGFGVPQTGSTIVVQLFTKSRRAELDLEGYWKRRAMSPAEKRADAEEKRAADPFASALGQTTLKRRSLGSTTQARFFSTSRSRNEADTVLSQPFIDDIILNTYKDPERSAADVEKLSLVLQYDVGKKLQLLTQMQSYFHTLPLLSRKRVLGRNALSKGDGLGWFSSVGTPTSSFLRVFDLVTQHLPPAQRWDAQLWLILSARRLQLHEYNLPLVARLVEQMRTKAIEPTQKQYLELLQAIYAQTGKHGDITAEQSELASKVIDSMFERGANIMSTEIIVYLMEVLARAHATGPETDKLRSNLEYILTQARLPYMGEQQLKRLLNAYADTENWDAFWDAWRIPAKYGQGRTEDLYYFMWRIFADKKNQAQCLRAIRTCFNDMRAEEPPVGTTVRIRDAIVDCCRVVNPRALTTVNAFSYGQQWVHERDEMVRILRTLNVGRT